MSNSLNKVMLIGRLGRDPEIRHTGSGTMVVNFSVATNERRKSQSGEWEEQTEWHDIVTFGKLAEICGQYLGKGKQVYLEGRLQTRKWEDKEGQQRRKTEVVANQMVMLGSPGGGGGGKGGKGGGEESQEAPAEYDEPMGGNVGGEDDIPF